MQCYAIPAYCENSRSGHLPGAYADARIKIARRTKHPTQYIPSPQWYVPRDNLLYTDFQINLFKYLPIWEWLHRLRVVYV
jgi:hypothetical protein